MRKRHTAEFKAKVALESVKGLKLVNEIASHYEVSPTEVSTWKKRFLECSVGTFKSVKDKMPIKTRLRLIIFTEIFVSLK